MKSEDIPAALIKLHAAINDKTEKLQLTPDLRFTAGDGNSSRVTLWHKAAIGGCKDIVKDSVEECLYAAHAYIDNLPSRADQDLTHFQAMLAKLIDQGRKNNIDLDFVNPLIAASKLLAENVITHVKEVEADDEIPF